jgi:glycerophosphoryl diester phosphodiesterase
MHTRSALVFANAKRVCICGLLFITALSSASAQSQSMPQPLVVGHRGLMFEAPENTLAAFRACLALRVGFEFDIRRTQDGQLVCVHDATLDRTTTARGSLNNWTLQDLKKVDAGGRWGAAFAGERVPTIEEIFELVAAEARGEVVLAADLKDSDEGLEAEVVRLAVKHGVLKHLLFIGLTIESPEIRQRLKAASPAAQTARLAPAAADIQAALDDPAADWVYVRFIPTASDMSRIRAANKRTFIAGPLVAGEEPDNWSSATKAGIAAILTDHPLALARRLRAK